MSMCQKILEEKTLLNKKNQYNTYSQWSHWVHLGVIHLSCQHAQDAWKSKSCKKEFTMVSWSPITEKDNVNHKANQLVGYKLMQRNTVEKSWMLFDGLFIIVREKTWLMQNNTKFCTWTMIWGWNNFLIVPLGRCLVKMLTVTLYVPISESTNSWHDKTPLTFFLLLSWLVYHN